MTVTSPSTRDDGVERHAFDRDRVVSEVDVGEARHDIRMGADEDLSVRDGLPADCELLLHERQRFLAIIHSGLPSAGLTKATPYGSEEICAATR
jgi:hypothetical protein